MLLSIPAYRSLRDGVTADVGRAIAMATGGALAFAPIEYAITVWQYAGSPTAISLLRLVALTLTLSLLLWLVLVLVGSAVAIGARLVRRRIDPAEGTAPGWFVVAPVDGGVRPAVPRVWGALGAAAMFVLVLQRYAAWAIIHHKEPQLTAALIAVGGVMLAVAAWPLYRGLAMAADVSARALLGFGVANPFGRWRAAGLTLGLLVGGVLAAVWVLVPTSRTNLPVRLVISGVVVALGSGFGLHHLVGRRRSRRRTSLALAGAGCVLVTSTLLHVGADPETKYIAITASPALDRLIGLVRVMNDLDRDGYGSLLGEGDCDPTNARTHPGDAIDLPDDGIDQNCDGHDFSLASLVAPSGPTMPVPAQFKRDWNILFLTIDTVRYDRTSFGGYATGPKQRDTTPRLAQLVKKSTSFTFAHAPSAGTMASIPAILTSKYFHSGIALDEKRPAGSPPGILPENTTLPEIMRRGGYKTGVIGSHEWWTGWGLEQGVDPEDYDNSIGRVPDPNRVVAHKVTDRALAWISRQQGKKWFLWAHYIDPHGRYVAHPDVVDYGSSDPDLYDAELKWTDQEVGRLLDELTRLPSYANTIVIITSDHGESMGEPGHGVTLGTHGSALYRELLHVPMIFFIPGNKPREVRGAVSNLDIVPTVAALCNLPVSDLRFEGRSLIPELFYGQEDRERIVFAETNAPGKQRAAISERWRLIYNFSSNIYQLFDQVADPAELVNLAPNEPPALSMMRGALELWMSRVMYDRDPLFNQAFRQISDVILPGPTTPPVMATGHTIDGTIEVLGIGPADTKPLVPGAKTELHVYFKTITPATVPYRFQFVVWQASPGTPLTAALPASAVRSPTRATGAGAYPPTHWKAGEYIRERFPFNVPLDWKDGIAVGLVVIHPKTGAKLTATGVAPANDPSVMALGILPMGSLPGVRP